jgi:hypothetical protein
MHRFNLTISGLGLMAVLAGCPGTLSDPGAFADAGSEIKDAETILAESCGTTGCHDSSNQAQAGLDLISPGVESRVVDVNASTPPCTDRILVVAGDPDQSYLLDKVINALGICGTKMPIVGDLEQEEIDVIEQWIIDLGGSSGSLDGV